MPCWQQQHKRLYRQYLQRLRLCPLHPRRGAAPALPARGPRRSSTKSAAGNTAAAPPEWAPARRPLVRPLAGGRAQGMRPTPGESGSLRPIQVPAGQEPRARCAAAAGWHHAGHQSLAAGPQRCPRGGDRHGGCPEGAPACRPGSPRSLRGPGTPRCPTAAAGRGEATAGHHSSRPDERRRFGVRAGAPRAAPVARVMNDDGRFPALTALEARLAREGSSTAGCPQPWGSCRADGQRRAEALRRPRSRSARPDGSARPGWGSPTAN